MGLAERVDGLVADEIKATPIGLRTLTEGPQGLTEEQEVALRRVIELRESMTSAGREIEQLLHALA